MLQLLAVMSKLCTIIWKQIYAARWSLLIFRSVIQRSRWLVKGQACSPTLGEGAYLWYKEGGGGPGVRTPPPLRFVRGGVLCRDFIGRGGGPTVVFALLFFSILYKHITCNHTSKFNLQYGTVMTFLYISLIKFMKRINFPSLGCFSERTFSFLFPVYNYTIFLHWSQKFSGGGPPDPPPWHIYNFKTTISSMCSCKRGACNGTEKNMPYPLQNKFVCK